MQDFAEPTDADVSDDLLFDEILTQFGQRPLGHADEGDGGRQGDFRDVFANVDGEHTCRTDLKPGKPGDAVDAVVVEPMNDLPHPLDGTADHFSNDAIAALADGEHDDAGIATVHGIALSLFRRRSLTFS